MGELFRYRDVIVVVAGKGRTPRTIREMLLWLYWLGQFQIYGNNVKAYIRGELKESLTGKFTASAVSASMEKITDEANKLIQKVCEEAGKILVTIQNGAAYSEGYESELKQDAEQKKFDYPEEGRDLYGCFVYYVTACYWQLQFLYKVCGAKSAVGGWGQCRYDKQGPERSEECKDTKINKQNHQQRCNHCSKNYKGCLKMFLTATQSGAGKATGKNIYEEAEYRGDCPDGAKGPRARKGAGKSSCFIPPMGFDKIKDLPNGDKQGFALHNNLNSYFKDNSKSFPKLLGHLKLLELLSTATHSSSQLGIPSSWIAGDFWALFFQLRQFWTKNTNNFKTNLDNKIRQHYDQGFAKNGSSKGSSTADYTDINDVFSNLLFTTHGNGNNHNSLLSLSECDGRISGSNMNNSSNKCGKYLYGLFSDPFYWVLEWFNTDSTITLLTLEVLKTLATDLKQKLSNLKKGLETSDKSKKCVLYPSCKCIVFCDDTHSVIYRYGFTFFSPTSLAVEDNGRKGNKDIQKRTCNNLRDQLDKVTRVGSALEVFSKLVEFVPPKPVPPKAAAAKSAPAKSEPAESAAGTAASGDTGSGGKGTQENGTGESTPQAAAAAVAPGGGRPAVGQQTGDKGSVSPSSTDLGGVTKGAKGPPPPPAPPSVPEPPATAKPVTTTVTVPNVGTETQATASGPSTPKDRTQGARLRSDDDSSISLQLRGGDLSSASVPWQPNGQPSQRGPPAQQLQSLTPQAAPDTSHGAGTGASSDTEQSNGKPQHGQSQPDAVPTKTHVSPTPPTTTPTKAQGDNGASTTGGNTNSVRNPTVPAVSTPPHPGVAAAGESGGSSDGASDSGPSASPSALTAETPGQPSVTTSDPSQAPSVPGSPGGSLSNNPGAPASSSADGSGNVASTKNTQQTQPPPNASGTVHKRDNNKDGVEFWIKAFGNVLKELVEVTAKATALAAVETTDAVVHTSLLIRRQLKAHHSSLLEPPCNIKECIDWLIRVGELDHRSTGDNKKSSPSQTSGPLQRNSMALEKAIKRLTGSERSFQSEIRNLIQYLSHFIGYTNGEVNGSGIGKKYNYHSAYKLIARWPVCGPATGGTNSGAHCRCCKTSQCNCQSTGSSSCDGQCCNTCDVRLCAGIFIAILPALHRALDKLKKRCNEKNWTKGLSECPVKGYLQNLGYEEKDLSTTTKCNDAQYRLRFPVQHLGKINSSIKDAFLGKNLRGRNSTSLCYFQAASGSFAGGKSASCPNASTVTCSTPTSIREMLLWLMGLPYCQGYEGFVDTLQKKYEEHNKTLLGQKSVRSRTGANKSNDYYLHRQYSSVIFQLPVLFFTVEADVSYLQDVFCQFAPEHNRERLKKISQDDSKDCNNKIGAFDYPCAGDKLCAMFYDYTYKVHLQLRFLLTMCNTEQSDGGWKHCRYAAGSAATRAVSTEAQDCCSKHNLLCTCMTQRKSKLPTTSTNCQRLLRGFLRDCQNKDPVTRNIFQAACSNLYVSMGFRVPLCSHETDASCSLICHYTGDNIKAVLSVLVDESKGPSRIGHDGKLSRPLSVVTQWMIGLQGQEPRSLGDILDLFRELCVGSNRTNASASALQICVRNGNNGNVTMASVLSEQLGALLEDENAYYFSRTVMTTGADTAKKEVSKIQVALYNVLDVWHHRNTTGPRTQGSDPNVNSLIAIMGGCASDRSKTCTAYIKSLSHGLYKYYAPEFQCQQNGAKKISCDHVLDWLFKWCKALYKKLKDLKEKIVKCCSCCLEASKKKDADCTSIVSCCHCLPELYKCALVLGDPKTLMGKGSGRQRTPKKCSDFMDTVSAVLLTSAPVFKACEAIMNTVYAVLLTASRNRVYNYIVNIEPKEKDAPTPMQRELIVAFHRYVDRAMQCSKKKLMETFLKPLCEEYKYQGCDDQCHKKDDEVSVSASSVTVITAVIPEYTAPHIDQYHYKAFKKQSDAQAKVEQKTENTYGFRDAIDFHVQGANCILPVPSNLRSAVDWILRVTVGDTNKNNSNEQVKHLSGEIKSVFEGAGVNKDDFQQHIVSLVDGLRKFMGYKDRSKDVIKKVKEKKDSVQEQIKKKIAALNNFIGTTNSSQFSQELGIALQKAMFTVAKNGNKSDEKSLKCVIEELHEKLQEEHKDCNELKCNTVNKDSAYKSTSSNVNAEGLKELYTFFEKLKNFAALWDSIGKQNGGGILQTQKNEAMQLIKCSGSSQNTNGGYFTNLYQALNALAACAAQVKALNESNSYNNYNDYRTKVSALITGLKKFGDTIKGCNFNGSETSNDKSDPAFAVNGAERLIEETKKGVETEITRQLQNTILVVYAYKDSLNINTLIQGMNGAVSGTIEAFKSHLDDLKELCQWLYRMGQLYAHGLKGFVESLIEHLKHISSVIVQLELLRYNIISINAIESSTNTEVTEYRDTIPALIAGILNSYVLRDADKSLNITADKASTYRGFLHDLRLLALDRYTLQLWEDNKERIKNWITFQNGIVRHSNLDAIKEKLHQLTGIAHTGNTPNASPPRSRIHDFHAICVIQKFSYEAPITRLEKSLEKLNGIQEKLNEVKRECDGGIQDVSSDDTVIQPFCTAIDEFLQEPYGIYSFAKFVHTILGPNIFSAVIGSLEELKEANNYQKNNGGNLDKIKGILGVLVDGLKGKDSAEHYKLEAICEKLKSFLDTLKREYIFAYPVVCGIECDKDCKAVCAEEPNKDLKDASLACSSQSKEEHKKQFSSQSSVTPSLTSASSTMSLTSPMPPLCPHCHVSSSICPECIPILARISITLVPILYPQFCYLAYQCRLYWCEQRINKECNPLSSLLHTFGWPRECLSDHYIGIDVQIHGRFVSWLLSKEENSLRLLCHNFTKDTDAFPFNKNSPLFKLYNFCVSYYRQRKNERLTEAKSTPPVMPTTLREILRFFVYLPFSTQFESLQEVLRFYCSASGVVHFSDLFTTMMMSSAMSAVLLQLIECPQGAFLRFFDDIYTNKEGLYLDNNTESLFYQLCDLSVTLYRSLKFLSLQCSAGPSLAGWRDCRLRDLKGNNRSEDISQALNTQQLQLCASHLCECQSAGAKGVTTATPMCLNSDSSVSTQPSHTTCPLPLMRYLTDGTFFKSTMTVPRALRKVCLNDSCQEMIYRNMAPRGWQKGALQCAHREGHCRDCDPSACCSVCHLKDSDPNCSDYSNCGVSCCHPCRAQCCAVTGASLFLLLRNLVGHEHDADPLLQFTRYMVSIAAWPPDSLSGYMTFMLRFSDWLRKQKNTVSGSLAHGSATQENSLSSSVLSSLKSEITLFPGEFDPKCLIDAFLKVTRCDHSNGAASSSSGTPVPPAATAASCDTTIVSQSSLSTSSGTTISVLRDCKDCKCIIYPLDYEIYDLYLPMYARRYLTWMLHFGPRLQRGLRALEKAFERHIGDSASQSRTSVECHVSVLRCPFALPELHSAGLHFWDRKAMCNVSCQCLVERLQCSIQDFSPLAEFLSACETFLWSVRKPFYWLTMALWIIATVYLLFVHLWRLDSWRLLSHGIRSRASHLVYPKVLLSAELDHSYERYYAQR